VNLAGDPPDSPATRELQVKMAQGFRAQGQGCGLLGSALYNDLLARAADDIDGRGPVWEVIAPYAREPGRSMLALRLMGATHRLAITGADPGLAAHYPSTGGDGDPFGAWEAWIALVRDHADRVGPLIANGVQTNEVGRAGALLGGFLEVARRTGLPLRILEVGASAGLNLRWDRFRYRAGAAKWGPPDSPVDLGDPFVGGAAPTLVPKHVAIQERRGCDLRPADPTSSEGRAMLLSYVWPDQVRRFTNLAGACDVAATLPVELDKASADGWVAQRLASPVDGAATVVFHSTMLQYVEAEARDRLLKAIAAGGERATASAPLAWLRMEPVHIRDLDAEVRLTLWPGGQDRRVATAHPHGAWVRWTG
jgi:hypothetical protein